MTLDPAIHPFPGLRPFDQAEEDLFFGREGQSEELLRRLGRNRLLAVIGSSGSGKSSLVRAGLLPYLHGGFLAGGSHWRIAVFRPGGNPVGNLAAALNDPAALGRRAAPDDAGDDTAQDAMLLEVSLRRSGLGLIDAVRLARLADHEQLLVVVDQFEELFRFAGAGDQARQNDDAAAFVKLLLEAAAQRELPIYVVLTMRSDFIGDCARYRDLPEAVTDGLYLIPRMTREQRRAAIVEPVRVGGGTIAPRLVTRLLNDVGDDPDQLPILQHALMRCWDYWAAHGGDKRAIEVDDYLAIGRMAQALSLHADEAFNGLPDDRLRAIARRMFQALTEKGGDNRETRRPTTVATLAAVANAPVEDIIRIVEAFRQPGRSFLMPPPEVPLDAGSLIDISHESLIRNWERLRQWVDEETESVKTYRRLAETAALHALGTAGLWDDPDLAHALQWREREQPSAAWAERYHPGFAPAMAFLDESRRARDARQRRQELARRRVQIVSIAIAAVLGVFAVTAGLQWRSAHQALAVAAQERDRARAGLDTATNVARRLMSDVWEGARIAGLPAKTLDELTHHAIEGYDQVIRMDPTNAIAYNARGVAYFRLLDFDHAFADIGRAIALNPNSSRAYNNRCFFAAMADRQLEQAVADCDDALRLLQNEAAALDRTSYLNIQKAALDSRGYANLRLGRLDAAIADFNAVLKIDPKYASSIYGRGLAEMQKGDRAGGEVDVAAAKAISSDTVEDLARYGIK